MELVEVEVENAGEETRIEVEEDAEVGGAIAEDPADLDGAGDEESADEDVEVEKICIESDILEPKAMQNLVILDLCVHDSDSESDSEDPTTFLKSKGNLVHMDKKGSLFPLPKRLAGRFVLLQRAGQFNIYRVKKESAQTDTYALQLQGTDGYAGYIDSVLLDPAKHGKKWWLLSVQ